MNTPEVAIGCVANLWSRQMHFLKKGDIEIGHTHQFDHLTLLAKGKLKVTIDGSVSYFQAPYMIYIRKDDVHELEALEDDTVAYCIHALRTGDQTEILDPMMIPERGIGKITSDSCERKDAFYSQIPVDDQYFEKRMR